MLSLSIKSIFTFFVPKIDCRRKKIHARGVLSDWFENSFKMTLVVEFRKLGGQNFK